MEKWVRISLLLCTFGFLKEFRPVNPFITQFFVNPPMNFTHQQVTQDIYPISTYSYMFFLIVVFLITDYLRYKPVIIADAVSGIVLYVILVVCRSLFAMQIVEVLFGLFMAGEVAYYTYIYAKVDKDHFQVVSSYTRSASLIGKCASGLVSQSLIYFELMTFFQLQYLTLTGLSLAGIWALLLPPVERSMYFHREVNDIQTPGTILEYSSISQNKDISETGDNHSAQNGVCSSALQLLWSDFLAAFTNLYVLKWIFWWALATGGYYQVLCYIQLLWEAIMQESNSSDIPWNGAVDTAYTIFGVTATLIAGRFKLNWYKVGEYVIALCSLGASFVVYIMASTKLILIVYIVYVFFCVGVTATLIAGRLKLNWYKIGEYVIALCSLGASFVVYIMASTESILIVYIVYVFFSMTYHTMVTIANSEVAKHINENSYGLIFGLTTFLALIIQSSLTYLFVGEYGFCLPVRTQYYVYSAYFAALGGVYLIAILFRFLHRCYRN